MKITNLDMVEKVEVTMQGAINAYRQVPISKNDGSPSFSIRVFTLEPGGHTPYHSHPFEHINYFLKGAGAVVTESGTALSVKNGDFVLVLPNEIHQYKNTSESEPLIFICAVPKEYE